MARRYGAPGAKTERARRRCGSGLRAWRHLGLNSVRLAPSRAQFSALGAILGLIQCARRHLQSLHVGAFSAKWRNVLLVK